MKNSPKIGVSSEEIIRSCGNTPPDISHNPGLLRYPKTEIGLLRSIAMWNQRYGRMEAVYLLDYVLHERQMLDVTGSGKVVTANGLYDFRVGLLLDFGVIGN